MRDELLMLIGAMIGFFLGLYSHWLMGNLFEYRAFLHQALFEVRLMSGRMKNTDVPQEAKSRRMPPVFRRNSTDLGGSALRIFSSFYRAV